MMEKRRIEANIKTIAENVNQAKEKQKKANKEQQVVLKNSKKLQKAELLDKYSISIEGEEEKAMK